VESAVTAFTLEIWEVYLFKHTPPSATRPNVLEWKPENPIPLKLVFLFISLNSFPVSYSLISKTFSPSFHIPIPSYKETFFTNYLLDRLQLNGICKSRQPGSRFLCHILCMLSMTSAQRTSDSCRRCHHNTPYHCEFHSIAKVPHVFLRHYAFGKSTISRRARLATLSSVLIKNIISYVPKQ